MNSGAHRTVGASVPCASYRRVEMSSQTAQKSQPQLDLSDVDHRVGKLVGGGQLWEPCTAMDIRRWVMAMDYSNPIHWGREFAPNCRFGGIVAPASFAGGMDLGHGVPPA